MHEIFLLITSLWDNVAEQQHLILLIEAFGNALDAEFKPYLAEILPPMLRIFDGETSEKMSNVQMKVFDVFPDLWIERRRVPSPGHTSRIQARGNDCGAKESCPDDRRTYSRSQRTRGANVSDHASRIIHPLIRTLSTTPNTELQLAVMETLCALVIQLGRDLQSSFQPSTRCSTRVRFRTRNTRA